MKYSLDNSADCRGGFTLIELLVAMAVMGIALMPLTSAYIASWKAGLQADAIATAQMLGRWKVNQLRVHEGYAGVTSTTGNFGADWGIGLYDDFDYTVSVEHLTPVVSGYEGKLVKIRVEYSDLVTGNERSIHCSTLASCTRPDFVFVLTKKTST